MKLIPLYDRCCEEFSLMHHCSRHKIHHLNSGQMHEETSDSATKVDKCKVSKNILFFISPIDVQNIWEVVQLQ
jgi:hypothetical protein